MKRWLPTILIALLAACSGHNVNENDPASLLLDAEEDIASSRYVIAIDKLRMIKNKFSYTSYAATAQIRMADVYFLQESFPEAAAAYETFGDLHPKHERVAYSMFRAGESYSRDIPENTSRDLKSADNAIRAFDAFMQRFPKDQNVAQARELRVVAYNRLAQKELQIAQFYLRREKYESARGRLERILDLYSDSKSVDEARKLLKELPNTKEYKP